MVDSVLEVANMLLNAIIQKSEILYEYILIVNYQLHGVKDWQVKDKESN